MSHRPRWIAALARVLLITLSAVDKSKALDDVHSYLIQVATELEPIDPDQVFDITYRKTVRQVALNCGAASSDWERTHLEAPILPKRKPKPGDQESSSAIGTEVARDLSAESPAAQRA